MIVERRKGAGWSQRYPGPPNVRTCGPNSLQKNLKVRAHGTWLIGPHPAKAWGQGVFQSHQTYGGRCANEPHIAPVPHRDVGAPICKYAFIRRTVPFQI